MQRITKQEQEILYYLKKGLNYTQIAKILGISKHTVKAYISAVIKKTI